MYKGFEELLVWRKSMDLVKEVIAIVQTTFSKFHPLADQLTRSAISIPSNIAEGCERGSNPDFIRFLYISRGSCAELRTQLELLKIYTTKESVHQIDKLIIESQEISKMIYGLIKSLKTQHNN
jgi:four helix bundle protein